MKSFDKQVKDLMRNIQKHVNKEIEKEKIKVANNRIRDLEELHKPK